MEERLLTTPSDDDDGEQCWTPQGVKILLANDQKVKVAGIDFDGILRGKVMSKEKFLSSLDKGGFGMSSAVFGWDMHDVLYAVETSVTSSTKGYQDFTVEVDLASMRRLPLEDGLPFFLLRFISRGEPVCVDGRNIVAALSTDLELAGMRGLAGVEIEFINFETPSKDGYGLPEGRHNIASYLQSNTVGSLRPLTEGMFGYSVTRPVMSKQYFHDIFDHSIEMRCGLEGWHTESGPGVLEGALAVSPVAEMADKVSIFKLLVRSLGVKHGVTPCFMAKPIEGIPGNSGHIHLSLTDLNGTNLFARGERDPSAPFPDVEYLSNLGRYFLAGVLDALPDIMPLLAPNINSYKRMVENYWAPIRVSWGFEDRLSSVRLVAPPTCKPKGTRLEVRVPGADLHPHYALSGLFRAGLRGVNKRMQVKLPPGEQGELLPNSLGEAVGRFERPGSVAREIMGDAFVDAFTISRRHELRVWREAVTDWEFKRYIETT